jgi:hypothetical protein
VNIIIFLLIIRNRKETNFDRVVAIAALGLFLTFLNQTFILNIDRSRSTYVLAWVDRGYISIDNSGNIRTEGVLSKENLNEAATIQRISENIDRGLISVQDREVHLTLVGDLLLQICEGTSDLFDLHGWKTNSQ